MFDVKLLLWKLLQKTVFLDLRPKVQFWHEAAFHKIGIDFRLADHIPVEHEPIPSFIVKLHLRFPNSNPLNGT